MYMYVFHSIARSISDVYYCPREIGLFLNKVGGKWVVPGNLPSTWLCVCLAIASFCVIRRHCTLDIDWLKVELRLCKVTRQPRMNVRQHQSSRVLIAIECVCVCVREKKFINSMSGTTICAVSQNNGPDFSFEGQLRSHPHSRTKHKMELLLQ